MTHVCPFCNVELSHDYEKNIDYFRCENHICMLGSFHRYEFSYFNKEPKYRSLLFTINNDNYRIDCSYDFSVTWIERIERILKLSLPRSNHYLPITAIKIDNFTFAPDAPIEDIAKIMERFLKLTIFL